MKKTIGLAVSIGIIVAVVGVFLAGAALAQEPTQTPSPATPAPATPAAPSGRGAYGRGFGFGAAYQALSTLLGMTPQEINDARKAGKTLSDIGKEKGVTDQQLIDALVGAHKTYLDQAVKDGKFTQAQADWLLQAAQTMAQLQITNPFAPGQGRMGFMMGGNGPSMGGGRFSGRGNFGWNFNQRGGRSFGRGGGMMPWGEHMQGRGRMMPWGNGMQGRDGWGRPFGNNGRNQNQPGATPAPSATPSDSSKA